MKNYIKSIMTAALLLVATGTWADNVTVITQVNGQASTAGGTATVDNPNATGNEVVTITVTPSTGYYLEDITAIKTIAGTFAQTRAPGLSEPLTLTKTQGDAEDGVSIYTFVMPANVDDASYGAEITVNFMPKKDPEVTAPKAITGLVYNTALQNLITAGSTTGGTMKYSLDGTEYATAIPQGKDAMDYTVYYKVEGNGTYYDVAAKSITVTINAKEVKNPTINLSETSFEYDGEEHKPTVTVFDGTTEIPASEYNVAYQKKASDSGSTGSGETGTSTSGTGTSTDAGTSVDESTVSVNVKDEGTYTVVVTDKKGGNYTISTATADYEIKASYSFAADGNWTWVDNVAIVARNKEKTYEGTPLSGHDAAFVQGLPSEFHISINISSEITDVGEIDYIIDSYVIYNSRNEDVTSHFNNVTYDLGKLIITPAPLKIWTGSTSKIYDGTPLKDPEAHVDGLVNGETATVTATGSQTDVGESKNTFEIKWDSAKSSNYTITKDLGTLKVETKEVKNPTIDLSPTFFIFDGLEHKPTVTVYDGTTEIPASEYNVNYSGSTGSGEIDEPGTYIVTITDKEGGNYSIGTATAEFEIVEDENIDVVVPPTPIEGLVYNGQPQALVKAGSVSVLREMQYKLSYENNWSTEIPVATNAGEYEVRYRGNAINALAKDLPSESVKVTIAPASLTVQTGSASKTYDGECLTSSEASITGLVNGETATVTATGSQTDVGESENSFEINWGDTNSRNYTISENLGTLTVETKEVKNPTINLSETSFEYDGQDHKPTVTVYDDDGKTKITESEYNVRYQKKTSDSGSTGSGETGTSTIGTGTSTEISSVDGSGASESSASGSSASVETKEVGTYIVTITDKKDGNYTLGTATAEYEIVGNSLTEPTAKKNLVYNGKAQALIVPPSFIGNNLEYQIDSYYKSMNDYNTEHENGPRGDKGAKGAKGAKGKGEQEEITYPTEWSTNIPEGKNAGVYQIFYRNMLDGEDNSLGLILVEIAPMKMGDESISLKETTLTYTGRALEPKVTVSGVEINGKKEILTRDKDFTITYLKGSDPVTKCIDVGRYSLMVTDIEGRNYKIAAMAEFEIVNNLLTDPTAIEDLTYNGKAQALMTPPNITGIELEYQIDSYYKSMNDYKNGIKTYANGEQGATGAKGDTNKTGAKGNKGKSNQEEITYPTEWSTNIPEGKNAGVYQISYRNKSNQDTNGSLLVEIAPKELKDENFFIGNRSSIIAEDNLMKYPAVDSVKVVLIEGDQPIKLQEGTDYIYSYYGPSGETIPDDSYFSSPQYQNKTLSLAVSGRGNYSGEVRRSFTNTPVFYSINEQTNTATITGLANSEATTFVIPAEVTENGANVPVTCISNSIALGKKGFTFDLTNFNLKDLVKNKLIIENGALEGNKVKVLPETLAFFASNPSLRTNVENGQLYADLKADYYLQTFSCGINITIPREKKITYVVGKDTVNLGTIHDITEYLKFYKCTVKENDGKDEVFVSSIHNQMKERFNSILTGNSSPGGGGSSLYTSLLYEANNGVLIACDTTSVINLIDQVDVASIANQVDLKSLATELGYGAFVTYVSEDFLKQYVLDNADEVKKKIKEQFRSTAATLVAQYTKDKPVAQGDAKTYGEDNMLVPVTDPTHLDATDEAGNTYYILYNGNFHKINDNIKTEVSACKAVLKVPGSLAKSRTLDITEGDDDTTVISAILAEGDGEARWYNLSGQRIEKPTKKGLYILNGHKVVIK